MKSKWLRVATLCMVLALGISMLSGCSKTKGYDYQFSMPQAGDTIAIFHTSMGDITVRFFPEEAPKAVENFTTLAQSGYYDGCEFFRVVEDFMIQAGDPTNTGDGGESAFGEDFEDEIVDYLSPYYGALCMANYGAYTGTNRSQFFIVTCTDNDTAVAENFNEKAAKAEQVAKEKFEMYQQHGGAMWLDSQIGTLYENNYVYTAGAHTVFGQVIDGMDVAAAISAVATYTENQEKEATILNPGQTDVLKNKPKEAVIIYSIEITTYQP